MGKGRNEKGARRKRGEVGESVKMGGRERT